MKSVSKKLIHDIRRQENSSKKMVESQNWKGKSNPLDDFVCWCCLEEYVARYNFTLQLYERRWDRSKDDDYGKLFKRIAFLACAGVQRMNDEIGGTSSHVPKPVCAAVLKSCLRAEIVFGVNL